MIVIDDGALFTNINPTFLKARYFKRWPNWTLSDDAIFQWASQNLIRMTSSEFLFFLFLFLTRTQKFRFDSPFFCAFKQSARNRWKHNLKIHFCLRVKKRKFLAKLLTLSWAWAPLSLYSLKNTILRVYWCDRTSERDAKHAKSIFSPLTASPFFASARALFLASDFCPSFSPWAARTGWV